MKLSKYTKRLAMVTLLMATAANAQVKPVSIEGGHVGGGDSTSFPYAALEQHIATIMYYETVLGQFAITGTEFKHISEKLRFVPQREIVLDGRLRDAVTTDQKDGTFLVQISRTRWNGYPNTGDPMHEDDGSYRRVLLLVHETLVAAKKETSDQYGHSAEIVQGILPGLLQRFHVDPMAFDEPTYLKQNLKTFFKRLMVQEAMLVCRNLSSIHKFGLGYSSEVIYRGYAYSTVKHHVDFKSDNKVFYKQTKLAFQTIHDDANYFIDSGYIEPHGIVRIDFDRDLLPILVVEPSLLGGEFPTAKSYDGNIWETESKTDHCSII